MIFCIRLLYILFACILSSTAAEPDENKTVASGKDDDFGQKMAAATLSNIAEDFNSTASKQALLAVSEILLVSAPDVLEGDQRDGTLRSDESDIHELIDSSTHIADEDKNIDHDGDKKIIDNVLLGIRAMPDNATIWELFKAQVQADFAPFLIIIPKPIKRLISRNIVKAALKLQVIFLGPTIHMVCVAGRVVGVVGQSVVRIGEDIIKVSHFISSADNYMTEKNIIPIQKISENDLSTGERVSMIGDEAVTSNSLILSSEETDTKSTDSQIFKYDLIPEVSVNNVDSGSSTLSKNSAIDDSLYDPLNDVRILHDSDYIDLDDVDNENIDDASETEYIEI